MTEGTGYGKVKVIGPTDGLSGGVPVIDPVHTFIAVLVAGMASILCIMSILSYLRTREGKLGLLSLGFMAFFIKGCLGLYYTLTETGRGPITTMLGMDAVIVLLIYLAVTRD